MQRPASALLPEQAGEIARAAGTVIVAYVLSRLLGLAREMAISQQFGTSGALDAYLAAFRVPDLVFQLFAGGALASAFVPTFAGLLASGREAEAWKLARDTIFLLLFAVGGLSALCAALARPLVARVVAPGFDPARQELAASLMRVMLLSPTVFAVSGVFMGILNSCGRFLAPALAPSAYNLCILLGALVLAPSLGVYGLALGAVCGAGLHYLVQLPDIWRVWQPSQAKGRAVRGLSPHLREVGRLMLPRTVGLAAVQVNFLVNTVLASRLPAGSLAALNYAWMLMLLPQGVFAQGVATAVFPAFSGLAARGELGDFSSLLQRALRGLLFLALPACLGLLVLRGPIVSLLFARRAFGPAAVQAVAWVLAFYAAGLWAHSAVEVVARAFYALHDTRTPVAVGVAAMAGNIGLSLALMPALGVAGLALANSIATWGELIALWQLLRRRLPGLSAGGFLPWAAPTWAATAGMAACLAAVQAFWPFSARALGAAGLALGGLLYASLAALLGAPEIQLGLSQLRAMRSGRRNGAA
jgi:putative peptidoglycan lipid II flippase